ncbi:type II toxin-antitoxin system prevent-host-death family antitoxin [Paenibacillus sp. PsM32]|uniref:type II toxin-antitoxin system Phd/YefM family antitoxin n=1 Tax=Paenibacillus sp. PsM32 TaxID=3030536 RepID=UPI00263AD795|nr:type II toxin-antitoxin system prevent-host-death family antitoxin [Paenibacillus sp. PsM32]MDN4619893.1 type II toxin-antitoxin system prevent-host-death family antitoxin [Paenibacillus sp. PsM32]
MLAIGYSQARNSLKEYLDKVTDDYETIIITRKEDKNVVVMSEDQYNNLMENLHVLSTENNRQRLLESKKQLEEGLTVITKIEED